MYIISNLRKNNKCVFIYYVVYLSSIIEFQKIIPKILKTLCIPIAILQKKYYNTVTSNNMKRIPTLKVTILLKIIAKAQYLFGFL